MGLGEARRPMPAPSTTGKLAAFIHYVLVRPEYQGRGIAGQMIDRILKTYQDYLYINLMPEHRANAPLNEQHGFLPMANGLAMHLCNYEGKCQALSKRKEGRAAAR